MSYRKKIRNENGTGYKTLKPRKPSYGVSGEERAATNAAPMQGDPIQTNKSAGMVETNHYGEPDGFPEKLKQYTYVNRCDTPDQITTGGPVVLNKGEHMFTIYPRRVDAGKTIRSNEE